jgi:hypothetical protein
MGKSAKWRSALFRVTFARASSAARAAWAVDWVIRSAALFCWPSATNGAAVAESVDSVIVREEKIREIRKEREVYKYVWG